MGYSLRRLRYFFPLGQAMLILFCPTAVELWRTLCSGLGHEANDDGYTPFSYGYLVTTMKLTFLDIHDPPASIAVCIIPTNSS